MDVEASSCDSLILFLEWVHLVHQGEEQYAECPDVLRNTMDWLLTVELWRHVRGRPSGTDQVSALIAFLDGTEACGAEVDQFDGAILVDQNILEISMN